MRLRATGLLFLSMYLFSGALGAQEFNLFNRTVQVHGFASQGFAYSDQNNYLTMKTSDGTFAMTDAGLNMSTQLTAKFRVGAQMYLRNVGETGNFYPKLDWAYGDYRFTDGFGVRAGKVKTRLGLYNDTQDVDSVHTFALLPQSVYPVDLRDNTIAHTGMDVYGNIPFISKSQLQYTIYAGMRSNDPDGGFFYLAKSSGNPATSLGGNDIGIDLRWNTPVQGLMVGVSQMAQTLHATMSIAALHGAPSRMSSHSPEEITAVYAEYTRDRWHFTGEIRRDKQLNELAVMGRFYTMTDLSNKGGFATAAFRVTKHLEVGTYHSRFYVGKPQLPEPAADHIFDQAVTARIDFNRFSYAKIEGHFMDGYGDPFSARGFYAVVNPNGLKPRTNMLVIRTGFSF